MQVKKDYPNISFTAEVADSLPPDRKLFLKKVIEQHFEACMALCSVPENTPAERECLGLFKAYCIECGKTCKREANLVKAKTEETLD